MASRVLAAERGPRAIARLSRRAFVRRSAALGAATLLGSCGGNAVAPSPTGPAASRVYRIGWLGAASAGASDPATRYAGIRRALRDLGYVEGQNLFIEFRVAEGGPERLPEFAQELIDLRVDLLLTATSSPALAAKRATTTIPIVFHNLNDPVGLGIVPSLARQGGNITGVAGPGIKLEAKRLEILKETVPRLASIVLLFNETDAGQRLRVQATHDVARALGVVRVQPIATNTRADLAAALEAVAGQPPDGLVDINPSTLYGGASLPDVGNLLDFLVDHRLPHMGAGPEFARAGGLMGLAGDGEAAARSVARMVDKVLRGANPGDLPIEENAVIVLALNLSMARKIGLTFPESVLRQATEVIQ